MGKKRFFAGGVHQGTNHALTMLEDDQSAKSYRKAECPVTLALLHTDLTFLYYLQQSVQKGKITVSFHINQNEI